MVIALTLTLAVTLCGLGQVLLRNERPVGDVAQTAWQNFCRKLARIGLERQPGEPPRAYAHRVMLARADLALEWSQISRLYTPIRYSSKPTAAEQLRARVQRFRPR